MAASETAGETVRRARLRLASVVADLEADLAAIAEATAASPDDEHDSEGSTVGYERARVGALLARGRRELGDLDAAEGRIAAGTYRACQECGGDIGADRLEALPATCHCVKCATLPLRRKPAHDA